MGDDPMTNIQIVVGLPDILAEGERIAADTPRTASGTYLWTDLVGAVQTAIADERARHPTDSSIVPDDEGLREQINQAIEDHFFPTWGAATYEAATEVPAILAMREASGPKVDEVRGWQERLRAAAIGADDPAKYVPRGITAQDCLDLANFLDSLGDTQG